MSCCSSGCPRAAANHSIRIAFKPHLQQAHVKHGSNTKLTRSMVELRAQCHLIESFTAWHPHCLLLLSITSRTCAQQRSTPLACGQIRHAARREAPDCIQAPRLHDDLRHLQEVEEERNGLCILDDLLARAGIIIRLHTIECMRIFQSFTRTAKEMILQQAGDGDIIMAGRHSKTLF